MKAVQVKEGIYWVGALDCTSEISTATRQTAELPTTPI